MNIFMCLSLHEYYLLLINYLLFYFLITIYDIFKNITYNYNSLSYTLYR